MRRLAVTSPTTVTLEVALWIIRTSTWGWLALPARRWTRSDSICSGFLPSTCTDPANGMLITPSVFTICSGNVVASVDAVPVRGSSAMAPNSAAGGASQTDTSKTSPGPTTYSGGAFEDSVSENDPRACASRTRRATESVTSMTRIGESTASCSTICAVLGPEEGSHAGKVEQPVNTDIDRANGNDCTDRER